MQQQLLFSVIKSCCTTSQHNPHNRLRAQGLFKQCSAIFLPQHKRHQPTNTLTLIFKLLVAFIKDNRVTLNIRDHHPMLDNSAFLVSLLKLAGINST